MFSDRASLREEERLEWASSSGASIALATGQRLGPYEILSALGTGGMGEVYRAKDTKLGREVALKVLPDTFTHDPERLARFRREAQVLAALNHPHIAQIHGLEESNGTQFLVLELVDGESLDKRIARGPIPTEEALTIAKQIAEALEAAHNKGIVHRDLKPANIALTSDGRVKVLDFGLAKAVEASGASFDALSSPTITSPAMMTQVGVILGTAAYMAPEQAKGKVADRRSDVWAFGCVLYEMLTGRRAFEGDDVGETLAAVIRGELNRSAWPRDLPPLIATLVRRALEKDSSRRIADFSTVSFLLSEASAPTEASQRAAPAATTPVRRRAQAAGLAVATLLIVAIVTIMTMRSLRPAEAVPTVTRFDLVTPPTTDTFSFALSADSRQLAFVATDEGTSRLWVRPFDAENARPLAGTEGARYPFWKPDGSAIGFFANGKLKRVDVAGGKPQTLTDVAAARGGAWNQDDVIVFAPLPSSGLMRIAGTGGTPVALTHPAPGFSHRWPQFLPDGRRFLFQSMHGQPSTHGVYLGSLDGREPMRLLGGETAAVYASPGYLLRVIDGVLVAHRFNSDSGVVSPESVPLAQPVGTDDGTFHSAFSVSPTALAHRAGGPARRQLVWLDRAGHVTGTVGPPDDAALADPELAPIGQRIAVNRFVQRNFDIYIYENGGGPHRFTFDPAIDSGAVWSPDASRVVFHSDRSGKFDLFEKVASGASVEQRLLATPQDKSPCDWSPDGRFLLYASDDPTTGSDLWALPMVGDGKPFPVVKTAREGQFSPDGRWMSYVSNEGGTDQVYIRPFPNPGGPWQVTTNGGVDPRWGRDGRELFYVAPDGKLMAVEIHVDADGRAPNPGPPIGLFPTRLVTGANISVGFRSRPQYAVEPDGRFLMNVTVDDNVVSPISIVLNWATTLKK